MKKNEDIREPGYVAIIPAPVRYDSRLKDKAKLIYGEITALCDKYGKCWATNKYFAELYGISITAVSLLIKNLKDCGYINSQFVYKGNSKEVEYRYLTIVKEGYLSKVKDPLKEKLKDIKENNTSINKERKKTTYDEILNELIEDDEVKSVFKEFIKMRKLIKKPLTDYALKRIINKLHKLSLSKEIQIEILNQSITNSWQDIYELKNMKDNSIIEVQTLSSDYYEVLE